MPTDSTGRELIELVQIDQDFCNNTYGVAPCTAGVYQFDFNGDGYISTQRRWNPDAVDPSFTVEFQSGFDMTIASRFFVQGVGGSFTTTELLFSIDSDGDFEIFLGGSRIFRLPEKSVPKGLGVWRIESIFSNDSTKFFFNSDLIVDASNSDPMGNYRDNSSILSIGASPNNSNSWINGSISDVKMWINTETTNDLVLDMPINDNSNTIKDYAGVDDGALTAGTGSWSGTGNQKCFNTYATCQDKPNYDRGTKSVTFKKNQAGDIDEYTIPSLVNFGVTLPELNIFSRDTKSQALGRFGKCSIAFNDLPISDNHLDPYVSEREYNPLENGTFWTKWLARNPYYEGWKVRLYDGLVGQSLAEMNVREYEIEKITNPDSNGGVRLTANDLMRRLDGRKAIFPPTSDCQLSRNLNDNPFELEFYTNGRLEPYTITAGWTYALIESEFIRIQQEPADVGGGEYRYTIIDRFQNPASHESGVSVTNAYLPLVGLVNPDPGDIIDDLLRPIFTDTEFDYDMMRYEIDNYTDVTGLSFKNFIKKPSSVSDILASLALSLGFYMWYDENENITKFKMVRDEENPVITLNQNNNLIKGSTKAGVTSDDRFTDAYISYDLNTSEYLANNQEVYNRNLLLVDEEAASDNEYGKREIYELNTNWIYSTGDAGDLAVKLLTQFKDPIRTISFQLDIKDNDLQMAQVFKLAYSGFTDIYGNNELINWICTGRTRKGDIIQVTAQEFKFNVPEE